MRSQPTTSLAGLRTNETDSGSRGFHLRLRRSLHCLLERRPVPHSCAPGLPLRPQWPRRRYSPSDPRAWRNADATFGRSPSTGQFASCLSRRRAEPGEIATKGTVWFPDNADVRSCQGIFGCVDSEPFTGARVAVDGLRDDQSRLSAAPPIPRSLAISALRQGMRRRPEHAYRGEWLSPLHHERWRLKK